MTDTLNADLTATSPAAAGGVPPAPIPPLLRADEVALSFGPVQALAGVSLLVRGGETVAIMGPSGCGKSTLLHCLAGVLTPDAGSVALDGRTLSAGSEAERSRVRRERMGFVFQDGQLLPELTNAENVALPLMLNGVRRTQAVAKATNWLARMGLRGAEDRRPTQLSGGQAQRVAIARALINAPRVVFADEPTGALDQHTSTEVLSALLHATTGRGQTLVMVTHDEGVAARCHRVVRLQDGHIVSDSSPLSVQGSTPAMATTGGAR